MRRAGRGLAGWRVGRPGRGEVRRGRSCCAHSRRAPGSGLTRPEERPGNGALRERLATVRLPSCCSRRTSFPWLRAGSSVAHCGTSVPELDRSDAGGFPGETGARVQLHAPSALWCGGGLGCSSEAGGGLAPLQGPGCPAAQRGPWGAST